MKKLSVLILATIFIFATTSCSNDDNETKKEEEFPTTGVVWKLQTVVVETNGENQNYVATDCELESTVEFKADKTFSRKLNINADGGECSSFIQSGTYTEDESRVFTLTYTEGENVRDSETIRISSRGLEELVVDGDAATGEITGTLYTYKF